MDNQKTETIVFFIGPGFGHYIPIANLAQKLNSTGYKILLVGAVNQESRLADQIRKDEFEYLSLATEHGGSRYRRAVIRAVLRLLDRLIGLIAKIPSRDALPNLLSRIIFGIRSYIKPLTGVYAERIQQLIELPEKRNIKMIFADGVAGAGINYLCAMYQIPWIEYTTSPANVIEDGYPVYPIGLSPRMKICERLVNKTMRFFNKRRQIVQSRRLRKWFQPDLESKQEFIPRFKICFSIKEIDEYANFSQKTYEYVGISPYKYTNDLKKSSLPSGGIYVTFGSTGTKRDRFLLRWLAQELIKYDLPIYMQILNSDILKDVKSHIEPNQLSKFHFIGRLPTPAYDVYSQARLVISHGGYGTVLESLYFGCPVLLIPNIVADRMEVARRAVENGYGHCMNYYNLNAQSLKRRINELTLNPDIQDKTTKIKELIRNNDNFETLFNEIFQLLSENPTSKLQNKLRR